MIWNFNFKISEVNWKVAINFQFTNLLNEHIRVFMSPLIRMNK